MTDTKRTEQLSDSHGESKLIFRLFARSADLIVDCFVLFDREQLSGQKTIFSFYYNQLKVEIKTERLNLRPLELRDAPFILELFNAPTFKENIGDRGVNTIEQAEDFLKSKALKFFKELGWGTYLISLSKTGAPIGTVGLYDRPGLDHPDFGYALLPAYEGLGYATESSKALLVEVDIELNFEVILAIVLESNVKSTNLLDKLEFKFDKKIEMEGEELMVYVRSMD